MHTALIALSLVLAIQDPAKPAAAKATPAAAAQGQGASAGETAFKQVEAALKALPAPKSREDMTKRTADAAEIVKKALADHAKAFESGDGAFWKAKVTALGDRKAGQEAFAAIAADPKTDKKLANAANAEVFLMLAGNRKDPKPADELYGKLDVASLDAETKKRVGQVYKSLHAEEVREGLAGKPLPAIPVTNTLNADAGFTLDKAKGKVLVIDFWATWCPPCRAVIPELVELQSHHTNGDVQVLGVTTFYGNGMDFAADSTLPHGGKTVRDLAKDAEIKVNENFIKAFKVNYPIVFTDRDTALSNFGITGIPTVFVVGKDGTVLGSVVGGGGKAKIEALVAKALGGDAHGAPADAAGEKKK